LSILFVDSTYDVTLALLSDAGEWVEFTTFRGQKASSTLQREAQRMLAKAGVRPMDLSAVVTVAGPGFYTGLRLCEGFADVFAFFGVPQFSFYSFEVPRWCGVAAGSWLTKAYRGEYFFCHWDSGGERRVLTDAQGIVAEIGKGPLFSHSETALDEKLRAVLGQHTSTLDLLRQHPRLLWDVVRAQELRRESFYFRAPEDEFRVAP
jgi:tRNA threonylcarbamoyladenosine biosynthesis protein TsaB